MKTLPEKEFLIGVDIGTLGSKGVIIDSEGKLLSSFFMEHTIDIPRPGWVEQDPERIYWREFKTIVARLLKESGVSPERVAGIGVSSLSPDACPVDEDKRPLRPTIIYMDRRAVEECELVKKKFGEDTSRAIRCYGS